METQIFLGKYRTSIPGGGGVGSSLTYQGEEIDSGKKVVIELVPSVSLNEEVRTQREVEAIAARKFQHANIAPLYDFGLENDHFIYVTEYVDGTRADEWVNDQGPMAAGPVLRVALQVVEAVEAALSVRLVHRAINPSNLILLPGQTAEGEWPMVKLLHFFGSPSRVSDSDGSVAAFDKALHYASPEQIERGTVDFLSEVYSLGCTLWFLLTGLPPPVVAHGPKGASAAVVAGSDDRKIPRKVRRLLGQMLSVNPAARAKNLQELRYKLQLCLAQVERREAVSAKWGGPIFYRRPSGVIGRPWRMETLALAALLIVITTISALVLPEYIRHRRDVAAGKPIGVVIGVPDPISSATPRPANMATNSVATPTERSLTTTEAEQLQSAPVATPYPSQLNASTPETAVAKVDETRETDQAFVSAPSMPPLNSAPQLAPSGATVEANNATNPHNPSDVASASAEAVPSREQQATHGEKPKPSSKSPVTAERSSEKTIDGHEVRRGRLVEPEVRKTEPVGPAEGPSLNQANRADRNELRRNRRTDQVEQSVRPESFDEPVYAPRPAVRAGGRSSREWVRGRLVGVTPDGRWMLELPSNRIIIVPPPNETR